jgi:hypothetical protein
LRRGSAFGGRRGSDCPTEQRPEPRALAAVGTAAVRPDGSPIANYPRDVFGLIAFTGGDGTAAQPYGYRRGYLDCQWLATAQHAQRGVDRFRDDFVVLEWVTWEFAESLQDGAKREVPKIGNLPLYRQMLAPHIKRRLVCEPDVARYIQIDPPAVEVVETDWDPSHLSLYLRGRRVRRDGIGISSPTDARTT